MSRHSITNNVKTVVAANATAAGTTEIDGSWIDTQGYQGVRFVAALGALTATQVTALKAQYSDDGAVSLGDVTGSATPAAADADSNKTLIVEIFEPQHRYVRPVVTRGTANAVLGCIIAELFNPGILPVTEDASVSQQVILNSP